MRPDKLYGLKNILFLAIEAKVVLEYNLCPELGLSNEWTDIIKKLFMEIESNINLQSYQFIVG